MLTVLMRHWDLFWLGSNKVPIFRSLLDLTASVLYNLAAVHQPSQEPQLPCGTQLHNAGSSDFWSEGCCGCCCCRRRRCLIPPSQRRTWKRRTLASEMRVILSVPWQVLFIAANGDSHRELRGSRRAGWTSWGGDTCFKLLIVAFFTPKLNVSVSHAVIGCLFFLMCVCIRSAVEFPC